MATFLSGVKDLARECGLTSKPSSVVSQTGDFEKIVEYYKNAYIELQNRHEWRWLRHEFTLNTVSGTDKYAPGSCTDSSSSSVISRFSRWRFEDRRDPPKIYLTSSGVGGERWLIWTPWEWFKTVYKIGSQNTNTGAPAHIAIDPQNNIVLGPSPNGAYTVTGDYYRGAQVLSEDGDTPEMPSQYHMLIVYLAMEDYGYFESAPEVLSRGQARAATLMRQLEANQLEAPRLAGALC